MIFPKAPALALLLLACSSLGNEPVEEPIKLYVQRALVPEANAAGTSLVIPGASWLEQDMQSLVEAGPTVFYDMRGRGRSSVVLDSKSMSLARDVDDLESLRIELGLERMSLLAWAYGAQVITRYALQHPERVERLVLVGPLPPKRAGYWKQYLARYGLKLRTEDSKRIKALRSAGTKLNNPELYCRSVQEASLRTFVHEASSLETMRTQPWVLPNLDPERSALHAQAILRDMGQWDWTEELKLLELPVLVVHGEHELLPLASSQAYVDALPNARLLLIPGAGHMPWLEQPESFFAPVNAFLSAHSKQQDLTLENR